MTDKEKIQILHMALDKACKWIRNYPPSDFTPFNDHPKYLRALLDNGEDPEGLLWAEEFLTEAVQELREMNHKVI